MTAASAAAVFLCFLVFASVCVVRAAGPIGSPIPAPMTSTVPGGLPWQPVVGGPLMPAATYLDWPTPWDGGFAAVQSITGSARRSARPMAVWHSTDGIAWAVSALPSGLGSVLGLLPFRGGLALVVADDSTPNAGSDRSWSVRIWRSSDAKRWRASGSLSVHVPAGSGQCRISNQYVSVADGKLVVMASMCRSGCCGISAPSPAPSMAMIGSAARSADPGGTFTWTSTTGRQWTRHRVTGVEHDGDLATVSGVARAPDGLLAFDSGRTPSLVSSTDGVAWHTVLPLPLDLDTTGSSAVARTSGGYLLVGSRQCADCDEAIGAWTAASGGVWTITPGMPEAFDFFGMATGLNVVLLFGQTLGDDALEYPVLVVSYDGGATWDPTAGWTGTAADWPGARTESCLGPAALSLTSAVIIGCPTGTAPIYATELPSRGPVPSLSPSSIPSMAPR